MKLAGWWFLLFVLVILGLVASVLYFYFMRDYSNSARKWLFWGVGLAGYLLLAGIILFAVYPKSKPAPPPLVVLPPVVPQYVQVHDTRTWNDNSPPTPLELRAIELDRKAAPATEHYKIMAENAKTTPGCLTDRDKCLAALTNDVLLSDEERVTNKANCENESATNNCVENVIAACTDAVQARWSHFPAVVNNFADWKKAHKPNEILAHCKDIV